MKRLFLLPLLALLTAIGVKAQSDDLSQPLVYGVAFYNLENLFDTINANGKYDLEYSPKGAKAWDSEKYWSKINNLAYCISRMTTRNTPEGPAVIGIAEVENKGVLEDLVNAPDLKAWNLGIVHHDSPDRRGVDVSLLYNPRLFTVVDVTNHTLVVPDNPDLRTRDQMCVTGLLGGDTLSIIVNHWPSRLGGQERSSYLREAAAELSKHIADSLWAIRPNQGVIVMGDLNDDPQDKSCAVALGAKREMKDVGPHGFFNPWWSVLDGGKGTLAYKGAWNLFDQIIVSGTLLRQNHAPLEYTSCKINDFDFLYDTEGYRKGYPRRTFASGSWLNGYSDHFPTMIFLHKAKK
ncbi:MAG: endonuclease/exonuclease/phosphatase family protein [Duncaniella sp.]|nr:endonuclease/exonuclease/phosphatase family protein [Duncaniella sp.]MDE6812918.1 endonuclease/exonuclease/phosphatase family protein [Duncaniella sp.]